MKHLKRISSMILALAMAFALAVPAFAQANADITVTVIVQEADKTKTPAVITTVGTKDITVPAGSNVYTLVQQMSDNKEALANDAVWKMVDIVDPSTWQPTGEKAHALVSLSNSSTDAGLTTTNVWGNHSVTYSDATSGVYEGTSWEYELNGVAPTVYMDQSVLSNGDTVVLSYATSYMTW